jgi:hypothetical protein
VRLFGKCSANVRFLLAVFKCPFGSGRLVVFGESDQPAKGVFSELFALYCSNVRKFLEKFCYQNLTKD